MLYDKITEPRFLPLEWSAHKKYRELQEIFAFKKTMSVKETVKDSYHAAHHYLL